MFYSDPDFDVESSLIGPPPDTKPLPRVTVKEVEKSGGRHVYLILDSAKEPIDSTTRGYLVPGLIAHWQKFIYG